MKRISFVLVVVAAGLAGCSSKSGGFGIAVMVPHEASAAALTAAAITTTPGPGGLTISDGTSTLVVTEAKLALSEIELETADDQGACSDTTTGGHTGCEEVEAGSTVLSLRVAREPGAHVHRQGDGGRARAVGDDEGR